MPALIDNLVADCFWNEEEAIYPRSPPLVFFTTHNCKRELCKNCKVKEGNLPFKYGVISGS